LISENSLHNLLDFIRFRISSDHLQGADDAGHQLLLVVGREAHEVPVRDLLDAQVQYNLDELQFVLVCLALQGLQQLFLGLVALDFLLVNLPHHLALNASLQRLVAY